MCTVNRRQFLQYIGGQPVALHDYKCFDNPYCRSEFTDSLVHIKRGQEELRLDFEQGERVLPALDAQRN